MFCTKIKTSVGYLVSVLQGIILSNLIFNKLFFNYESFINTTCILCFEVKQRFGVNYHNKSLYQDTNNEYIGNQNSWSRRDHRAPTRLKDYII